MNRYFYRREGRHRHQISLVLNVKYRSHVQPHTNQEGYAKLLEFFADTKKFGSGVNLALQNTKG